MNDRIGFFLIGMLNGIALMAAISIAVFYNTKSDKIKLCEGVEAVKRYN